MNSQNLKNDAPNELFTGRLIDWSRFIRSLWQEHFDDPLSVAELALEVYLLDRANHHRWAMPFVCQTAAACHNLQISKPTFIKARNGLSRRGMITFTEGSGTNEPPTYSVVLPKSVLIKERGDSRKHIVN